MEEELAPLNAQIELTRRKHASLEEQLRVVEGTLETFSEKRQRFEALGEVCNALEKLGELEAGKLFWDGISKNGGAAEHLARVRGRVARFEDEISGVLEKQTELQTQIQQQENNLEILYDEVREAYEREERRTEEFVVEREISDVPYRPMIMPWTKDGESERRFRRAVLVALLLCFTLGTVFRMVTVPIPDRKVAVVEIPQRLAKLVKKAPPKPAPPPRPAAKKAEQPKPKDAAKPSPKKSKPQKKAKPNPKKKQVASKKGGGKKAARKKAERVGVLAFKSSFADLMEETPIAKLGTEARIKRASPRVAGQAVAQRSLVAMQATGGTSGGIGMARVSRNVGSASGNGIGGAGIGKGGSRGNGAGFADVESSIADVRESDRPLSDGPGPGRTDEEIQIVFDRYKATLYRIYNRQLRRDPTLRGKILLRIRIETNGAVSLCKVESTDLASPELVAKIVARIKRFNFGAKADVPAITILYPIDFLPAG
jgi:outer membrane biosynthesis protein TonB